MQRLFHLIPFFFSFFHMQGTLFDEIQPTVFKKLSAFFNYFCLSLEESQRVMQVQGQCRVSAVEKDKREGLGNNLNKISIAEIKYRITKEKTSIWTRMLQKNQLLLDFPFLQYLSNSDFCSVLSTGFHELGMHLDSQAETLQ